MISEAVKLANAAIAEHPDFLQKFSGFWIIFNKDKQPYLGLETMRMSHNFQMMHKTIHFYELSDTQKVNFKSHDASVSYELDFRDLANKALFLSGIYVKEEHARKGLGAEMLAPLTLNASEFDFTVIEAYCSPFDHAEKDKEKVVKFYQKLGFDIKDGQTESMTQVSIAEKKIDTAKHKIIQHPGQIANFKLVIPERNLFASHIQGKGDFER